jgi:hypothetical protein
MVTFTVKLYMESIFRVFRKNTLSIIFQYVTVSINDN